MKRHETETPDSCRRNDGMLCCCNHPQMDLSRGSSDAAHKTGFCAPGNDASSEYAPDTTAWD